MVKMTMDLDEKSYEIFRQVQSYILLQTGEKPSISELVRMHFTRLFLE